MLKLLRTNFDRSEQRRDRRYLAPGMTVVMRGAEYATRDWSLGGFQCIGGPEVSVGTQIAGEVRIAGRPGTCPFAAQAVRGGNGDSVAFRFTHSTMLITMLDRALSNRLARRRG